MAGKQPLGPDQLGMPAFDLSALQNVLNVTLVLAVADLDCMLIVA